MKKGKCSLQVETNYFINQKNISVIDETPKLESSAKRNNLLSETKLNESMISGRNSMILNNSNKKRKPYHFLFDPLMNSLLGSVPWIDPSS